MLGYVHLQHPTMILPMPFFITVTTVMSVTSVILMRIYCFRFYFLLVTVIIFVKMVLFNLDWGDDLAEVVVCSWTTADGEMLELRVWGFLRDARKA